MAPNTSELSHAHVRAAVRGYLDKWEAWEKENKRDAHIGNSEWAALSVLAQRPFQELDYYNYIGKLNEWITKNSSGGIPWDEGEFTDPVTKQRLFQASVKLPGSKGMFPREGYGFGPGEKAPVFVVKKKAKQFAAKYALAWLKDQNPDPDSSDSDPSDSGSDVDDGDTLVVDNKEEMPAAPKISELPEPSRDRDGSSKANRPAPTVGNSPDRKKVRVAETETQMGARLTSPGPGISSKSYGSTSDEPPSLPKQVDALAKKMGFDVPKYTVTCEPDSTWSGRPVFQIDGRMPEDLGIVTGLESEAQARVEMAQAVFGWLVREHKRRTSECDQMLDAFKSSEDNPLVSGMIDQLDTQLKTGMRVQRRI